MRFSPRFVRKHAAGSRSLKTPSRRTVVVRSFHGVACINTPLGGRHARLHPGVVVWILLVGMIKGWTLKVDTDIEANLYFASYVKVWTGLPMESRFFPSCPLCFEGAYLRTRSGS